MAHDYMFAGGVSWASGAPPFILSELVSYNILFYHKPKCFRRDSFSTSQNPQHIAASTAGKSAEMYG